MRSIITNQGRELLSQLELGEISMIISEVRTGNGIYLPEENISNRTTLKSQKNVYPIRSKTRDQSSIVITAAISNINDQNENIVAENYHLNEIGIYVTVNNIKYLYLIAVADNDSGFVLPSYIGTNPISFIEKIRLTISETANITVDLDGVYALIDDVEDMLSIHENKTIHITENERMSWNGEDVMEVIFNEDGSIEETNDIGTKVTEFNEDGSIKEIFPSGRILLTEFNEDGSISRSLYIENENNGGD